jgi:hypothetical protein
MSMDDEILQSGENKKEEQPGHSNWMDKVVSSIQQLDADFPLSGGESEEDFAKADDNERDGDSPELTQKTSFEDDLETDFPLSGGEVEK